MAVKSDRWIRRMALEQRMIEPFSDKQVRDGVISYGVSSYGYDVRIADEFKIFTNINSTTVDPKNFDPKSFVDFKGAVCVIPPNSFALARTVEYFRIPRNVITVCVGKSTYARCGIIVNVTPFEPEWEGIVTLEVSNTTLESDREDKLPIYARVGIPVYWIVNVVDRQVEVYEQPSGPAADPSYGVRRIHKPGDAVPLVLDGTTVGTIPAADLLP